MIPCLGDNSPIFPLGSPHPVIYISQPTFDIGRRAGNFLLAHSRGKTHSKSLPRNCSSARRSGNFFKTPQIRVRLWLQSEFSNQIRSRKNHGFTLIELLVVVAIIGYWSPSCFPPSAWPAEQARTSLCASRLHKLGLGVMYYAKECGGIVPFLRRCLRGGMEQRFVVYG